MYELMNVYLENGLKVVLHRLPSAKTVACGVWVKQGSKYEDDKTNGLSHLLEHLIITSNNSILDEIAEKGIVYNATTQKEYTSFYFTTITENLELCISTLSKLLMDFKEISTDTFDNEKKVVEIEAVGYYSSFKQIAERSAQALWGNVNIGRIIVGNIENIKASRQEDIFSLYNNSYTPANSTLVLVGGFEYDYVLNIIQKYFFKWKDRYIHKIEVPVNKESGIYLNTECGGDNTITSLCFKLPGFDNINRNNIEVLSLILGDGGIKSRLVKEIRMKRGLAYIINSFESFYEERGILGFASVCNPIKVNDVVKLIIKELIKCKKEGFSTSEIESAKNKLITKRILCSENISEHLKYLAKCANYNFSFSLEQEIRNIRQINAESLNLVVNRIFADNNMGFAAIGDFNVEQLLENIKFS